MRTASILAPHIKQFKTQTLAPGICSSAMQVQDVVPLFGGHY